MTAENTKQTVMVVEDFEDNRFMMRRLLETGKLGEVMRYESRLERWRPAASDWCWWPAVRGPGLGP